MGAMHTFALAFATGLSAFGVSGNVDPGLDRPGPVHSFQILDGGAVRVVERGPVPGSYAAPVPGLFRDPLTGRTAPVLIGASVIVRSAGAAGTSGTSGTSRGPSAPAGIGRLPDVKQTRVLSEHLGLILVESTRGEDSLELAARLAPFVRDGILLEAYPDLAFRHRALDVAIPPDDPRYGGQFYLDEIEIEDAWAIHTGSADVTVLVADNGCDLEHPDLVDKMDPGVDPIDGDGDPSFEPGTSNEHGTACAGIIAASTDNGRDIAGTCPQCRLSCARLLPAAGELSNVSSDVLTFAFALEADVDVVSNSWGFVDAIPVPSPLKDAIMDVQQNGRGGRGAVVVFASGNDSRIIGDDELLGVPGILGVGAVNNLGELTQFSNGGSSVDVVAPTGTITTDISGPEGADPGDVTVRFGGTSSACPVVAGVAALLVSYRPEISADDVNAAIEATARQSVFATPDGEGHDDYYGFGLVQPAAALRFFDVEPPPPPPVAEGCSCAADADTPAGGAGVLAAILLAVPFAAVSRRGRRSSAA